jgi:hypothetical protein
VTRKAYGDFPGLRHGHSTTASAATLPDQLRPSPDPLHHPGNPPALLAFDDASLPGANRQMRSFLSVDDVTTNDNSQISANDWRGGNAACREFVDAWGNPYDYRYRVFTSAARFQEWSLPTSWWSPAPRTSSMRPSKAMLRPSRNTGIRLRPAAAR